MDNFENYKPRQFGMGVDGMGVDGGFDGLAK